MPIAIFVVFRATVRCFFETKEKVSTTVNTMDLIYSLAAVNSKATSDTAKLSELFIFISFFLIIFFIQCKTHSSSYNNIFIKRIYLEF